MSLQIGYLLYVCNRKATLYARLGLNDDVVVRLADEHSLICCAIRDDLDIRSKYAIDSLVDCCSLTGMYLYRYSKILISETFHHKNMIASRNIINYKRLAGFAAF